MSVPNDDVACLGASRAQGAWDSTVVGRGESEPLALLLDEREPDYATLESIADTLGIVLHHAQQPEHALSRAREYSYEMLILDAEPLARVEGSFVAQLLTLQPSAAVLLSGPSGMKQSTGQSLGSIVGRCDGSLLGSIAKPWEVGDTQMMLQCALDFSLARQAAFRRDDPCLFPNRILAAVDRPLATRLPELFYGDCQAYLHVGSLSEAMVLAGGPGFDAIVVQLDLPDACGLDAVVKLRRVAPKLPLIALSPSTEPAMALSALKVGAQDVLHLPMLTGELLRRSVIHAIERHRALADINHRALHDELTSLAKRTLLHQRVANALARSRRLGNTFAIIYIDLDRFKWVNDNYGHDVGDRVLVEVSLRLQAAVREYDTVARLGGDEFAILLDTLEDPAEAERVAERVLASLSEPICSLHQELSVTASMGISVFPQGGSGVEELLKNADQAMYCAKRSGRNRYSLTPVSDEAPESRRTSIRAPLMRCP